MFVEMSSTCQFCGRSFWTIGLLSFTAGNGSKVMYPNGCSSSTNGCVWKLGTIILMIRIFPLTVDIWGLMGPPIFRQTHVTFGIAGIAGWHFGSPQSAVVLWPGGRTKGWHVQQFEQFWQCGAWLGATQWNNGLKHHLCAIRSTSNTWCFIMLTVYCTLYSINTVLLSIIHYYEDYNYSYYYHQVRVYT